MHKLFMKIRVLPFAIFALSVSSASAQPHRSPASSDLCPRPAVGSVVTEPEEISSHNGVLTATLTYRNFIAPDGQQEFCYISNKGGQAPTLRLKPGDLLILRLRNELTQLPSTSGKASATASAAGTTASTSSPISMKVTSPCAGATMMALSTNLHFHGLTVPPTCHEDDVLRTMVEPGGPAFEYRFRIPGDEPPGLYWYHPHVHGFTNAQVQGGASGALIIEGIEQSDPQLAGMPERIFIVRDQGLLHPDAKPVQSGNVPPPIVLRDPEGDILNTGTGGGKPARDLSINFIPVPFPNYTPAKILMRPSERQLWRVLNASAITYLDLQVLVDNAPQPLGVVSLDGVPLNWDGQKEDSTLWQSHILMPPAGRVEFVIKGFPKGVHATFVTRTVDTGPAGENDPTRPLANITVSPDAPEPPLRLSSAPPSAPQPRLPWLGDVKPVRTRTLYFSEHPQNPRDPNSPTVFMITVEGQTPEPFDPHSTTPNITVHRGDVEDWIIENRTQELHAFHIHQLHFLLVDWNGVPLQEPYLRDTINVPYWDAKSPIYPSVKLRMDFRDPNIVGTFVYHCHLLEHEDGGMMGTIRVLPKDGSAPLSGGAKGDTVASR